MPSLEFVGYSQQEAQEKMQNYKPLFANLPFKDDFIFVFSGDSKVFNYDGSAFHFVRITSRFKERIDITRKLIDDYEGSSASPDSKYDGAESYLLDFQPHVKTTSCC